MVTELSDEEDPAAARGRSRRLLAANTIWGVVSEAIRMSTALVVFFILTARFEIATYGRLIGALAILHIVVPVATLGSTYLLLQRVAGEGWDRAEALSRAVGMAFASGVVATAILLLAQPIVLPQVSMLSLGILGFTELALMGAVEACVFLAQATERLRTMAQIRATNGAIRLLAAVALLVTTTTPDLWIWATYYALAATAGLLMAQIYLLGRPLLPAIPTLDDLRQGLPFSLGGSAEKIRSGSDAFMLVRFDQPVEAGIYGAANRLMGAATAPIRALSHATNARAYEAGARSIDAVRRLTLRMALLALGWAVPLGMALAIAGPWIVEALPADYAVAGTALQWMAVLPALSVFQMFGSTALTASGHQRIRVQLMLATALANVALNAILIPDHGWRGALAATIGTTLLYGVSAWTAMTYLARRERPNAVVSTA